jgi:hypothetical protein
MGAPIFRIIFIFVLMGKSHASSSLLPSQDYKIITNPLRTDGFGAQFQTIIYSVIYSELTNNRYVYTPFCSMEHNYDMDPEFIAKKEWLINFIGNFPLNRDSKIQSTTSVNDLISFFESNLVACYNSQSLQKIRGVFFKNKNRNDYFDAENFHIAIHVRRPNPHDSRVDGTNTPDHEYLRIIKNLRNVYSVKKPLFHIYSQGNIESFNSIYTGDDIFFHLNESTEQTFTSLVLADVLVTSRSSFSYTAGILSQGVIYYTPFWHPPLPNWISISTTN